MFVDKKYTRHGLSKHELYKIWYAMLDRCYNKECKSYKYYGNKGVVVCKKWRKSFKKFLQDMEPRPRGLTLERINTEGDYKPSNCKWATRAEQSQNSTNAKLWHVKGKVFKSNISAAQHFNVCKGTVFNWCCGVQNGKYYYPSKKDCYVTNVYKK